MAYGFNDDRSKNDLSGKANVVHEHDAADVTSGTFDAERIPALDASKIESGILGRANGGTGASGRQNGSIAFNSSVTPNGDSFDCWTNGVCVTVDVVDLTLNSSLASGGNLVVGTVPEGFRPHKYVYNMTTHAGVWARVTTGGELRLTNRTGEALAAGTGFAFTITFAI